MVESKQVRSDEGSARTSGVRLQNHSGCVPATMSVLCAWMDGSPHPDDPHKSYEQYGKQWETDMMHSPCNNCKGFCCAAWFPCCFSMHLRTVALQGDMTKYSCCQGYFCDRCCAPCNDMAQNCPSFCLCIEAFVFHSCAISATRIYVQEERQITTDPCDNRLIRFNNCVQLLACIFHLFANHNEICNLLATIFDFASDVVYCTIQACMQAQTHHELTLHPTAADYGAGAYVATTIVTQQPQSDRAPLLSQQAPPAYTPK